MNHVRRILLIEDNPGDARLLREMFVDMGGKQWTLRAESSLAAGIDACHDSVFDIVLLDLSLPDSFGLNTLLGFRAEIVHTPVIVLTGMEDEEIGLQAVQSGAQDYLVKGEINGYLLIRAIVYGIERHQNSEALRRSEEAYRSLINDVFDNSTISIFILDQDFRVVWMNHASEVYFGIPREEIIGQDKRILAKETLECLFEEPSVYTENILRAYETNDYTDHFECHVLGDETRQDRWLEHWSQPIHSGIYAGGRIENYADVTEHKHAKDTLRQVAVLEERQRIARELHDSVTQSIFSANLMAESALRQWSVNPDKAKNLVEQIQQLTSGTLSELRVLLLELRPQTMEQVRLPQLTTLLVNATRSRRNVDIQTDIDDLPSLPADIQLAFYRIMQEALNNIVKHTHATQTRLSLKKSDGGLRLFVEDNGHGFDPLIIPNSSMGMSIMRERAESIHATLEVNSTIGHGTTINVFWKPTGEAGDERARKN
jgi:PAS domain S-box-containing protein